MSPRKELVLDANILLRAVFGARVRQLLETYEDLACFYSPDVCFGEAYEYIPDVAKRRGVDSSLALAVLEEVSRIVVSVDRSRTRATRSSLSSESSVGTQTTGRSSPSR